MTPTRPGAPPPIEALADPDPGAASAADSGDEPGTAHDGSHGGPAAAPVLGAGSLAAARSFEDLYRDEYDGMVRVAFLLVGSLEIAEELVQDAFIRVHLRWERLDAPAAFLRTCVVNACRDRIRRRVRFRARLPRLVVDATARSVAAEGGDAGPAAELHDVLLALPMRQRTAVVGRYLCGWDDATIAAALGVRPATIRSLVHRGLAALRTEIPR